MKKTMVAIWIVAFGILGACGVKGPPLPPVADTPANSDRAEVSSPSPRPSPVPSTVPRRKKSR